MNEAQQNITRLQGLIGDPNTSEALKVGYLAQQTEWVKRLPVEGKFLYDFCFLL